jgi:hypothetical protein
MQTLRRRFTLGCLITVLAACCHTQQLTKKRSATARAFFIAHNPCPSTGQKKGACPGYIVDHIVAIKHGGGDNAINMQWQTVQDAKEKDRWE